MVAEDMAPVWSPDVAQAIAQHMSMPGALPACNVTIRVTALSRGCKSWLAFRVRASHV